MPIDDRAHAEEIRGIQPSRQTRATAPAAPRRRGCRRSATSRSRRAEGHARGACPAGPAPRASRPTAGARAPSEEREERQHARRELFGQGPSVASQASDLLSALPDFVADEHRPSPPSAAAGSRWPGRRRAPAAAAPDVRYGFSSSTISPSNTPRPPGTWLAKPISSAARNAPRKARNESALGGSRT